MTTPTGLASTVRPASAARAVSGRVGIASLPPPIEANPYQRLLYEQLDRHGFELEPVARFRASWLWSARRRVGRLHFHWPQVYYHDARLCGAASWLRLALFAGRLATARALGYRIAWTVHQVHPHESPSRRLDRLAGRTLARASDVLIVHDAPTAEAVGRELRFRRSVHVLPHPPYAGAYRQGRDRAAVRASLGIDDGAFVFLCFGHVRAYKDLGLLLEAFAAARLRGAALIVAGSAVDADAADAVRRAAAADARIVPLLEFVPDERVAELHAAADAAVIARSDGGTSGALVLARTLGLPVVAAAAYADRIGAAGWTFRAGSPSLLAAALERAAAEKAGVRGDVVPVAAGWEEIGARTAVLFRGGRG